MATKRTKRGIHPLDREPWRSKIRRATESAKEALAVYGEPTMSLQELRARLKEELGDVLLSEEAIKNRKASY